jgi:hypothetical protein
MVRSAQGEVQRGHTEMAERRSHQNAWPTGRLQGGFLVDDNAVWFSARAVYLTVQVSVVVRLATRADCSVSSFDTLGQARSGCAGIHQILGRTRGR